MKLTGRKIASAPFARKLIAVKVGNVLGTNPASKLRYYFNGVDSYATLASPFELTRAGGHWGISCDFTPLFDDVESVIFGSDSTFKVSYTTDNKIKVDYLNNAAEPLQFISTGTIPVGSTASLIVGANNAAFALLAVSIDGGVETPGIATAVSQGNLTHIASSNVPDSNCACHIANLKLQLNEADVHSYDFTDNVAAVVDSLGGNTLTIQNHDQSEWRDYKKPISYLLNEALQSAIGATATFDRTGEATFFDYEGRVRTVPTGQPRFMGARYDGANFYTTRDDSSPIDQTDFFADEKGPFGLVVEGPVQNDLDYSEDFTHTRWQKIRVDIDPNNVTGPDGVANSASTMTDNNNGGTSASNIIQTYTPVLNERFFFTGFFKKAAGSSTDRIRLYTTGMDEFHFAYFDLVTGQVTGVSGGHETSGMIELADGWWYCYLSITSATESNPVQVITSLCSNSNSLTYTKDGTSSVHLFGLGLYKVPHVPMYVKSTDTKGSHDGDKLDYPGSTSMAYDEGTISCEFSGFFEDGESAAVGENRAILGSGNNQLILFAGHSSNDYSARFRTQAGDIQSNVSNTGNVWEYNPVQAMAHWGPLGNRVKGRDQTGNLGTYKDHSAGNPLKELCIGSRKDGGDHKDFWAGTIRNVKSSDFYWELPLTTLTF